MKINILNSSRELIVEQLTVNLPARHCRVRIDERNSAMFSLFGGILHKPKNNRNKHTHKQSLFGLKNANRRNSLAWDV